MNKQKLINTLVVAVVILLGVVVYLLLKKEPLETASDISLTTATSTPSTSTPSTSTVSTSTVGATVAAPTSTPSTPTTTPPSTPPLDLNSIFSLSEKEAGTKIYYSAKLGVGFTYLPTVQPSAGPAQIVNILERGNMIYLYDTGQKPEDGQSLEVLSKDASSTLTTAIQKEFLIGYSPSDCFVKVYPSNDTGLADYLAAGISYPAPTKPDAPFWQNADKCPALYSETNAIQYFLMNKNVTDKFIFVRVGQYSITSDGIPSKNGQGFNWSHSIRILQ